jgi:hypothetical protein
MMPFLARSFLASTTSLRSSSAASSASPKVNRLYPMLNSEYDCMPWVRVVRVDVGGRRVSRCWHTFGDKHEPFLQPETSWLTQATRSEATQVYVLQSQSLRVLIQLHKWLLCRELHTTLDSRCRASYTGLYHLPMQRIHAWYALAATSKSRPMQGDAWAVVIWKASSSHLTPLVAQCETGCPRSLHAWRFRQSPAHRALL